MRTNLHYTSLDSTAREYDRFSVLGFNEDRWIISAGEQTCGMGRGQNTWFSPLGGLYLSFDLIHPVAVPSLSLYVGYCLHKLLLRLYNLRNPAIKWPNDIYLDGAKLAGILCKYVPRDNKYIIGIGMNTNLNISNVKLEYDMANLYNNIGMHISNSFLAQFLVTAVEADARILETPAVYIDYCDSCLYGRGQMARVTLGDSKAEGKIAGLGTDGSIILIGKSGGKRSFASGSLNLLAE